MPAMIMVILSVVSLMVLSIFSEIRPLPREEYDKAARQKVLSAYHQTGSLPSSAVVFGRAVTVPAGSVSVDRQRKVAFDVLDWRRAMVEQALINTCITMMARCGKKDKALLWAFMPSDQGLVSSLLSGTTAGSLDCGTATATEYEQYGRYLLNRVLDTSTLAAISFEGSSLNFYYSRPAIGEGCSYSDVVDLR